MLKNSEKKHQKKRLRGLGFGVNFCPICTRMCVRIMRAGACVRACVTRANQEARASTSIKRLARALRVLVSSTCQCIGSLRVINASREKNPGLFIFKKNILNLDL
jgi:hypothetical protein